VDLSTAGRVPFSRNGRRYACYGGAVLRVHGSLVADMINAGLGLPRALTGGQPIAVITFVGPG